MSEELDRELAELTWLKEGQLCQRCQKPKSRHQFTRLGAVRCLDLPQSAGLARWNEHRFMTIHDKPYLSIMEQVGQLAGMLEERGLPDAYEPALETLENLRARITDVKMAIEGAG